MKVKYKNRFYNLDLPECCGNIFPVGHDRPELSVVSETIKVCSTCHRLYQKCVAYSGDSLQIVNDWVPLPFSWEKPDETDVL